MMSMRTILVALVATSNWCIAQAAYFMIPSNSHLNQNRAMLATAMNSGGMTVGQIFGTSSYIAGSWNPGSTPSYLLPPGGYTSGSTTYRTETPTCILDDGSMYGIYNLPWRYQNGVHTPLGFSTLRILGRANTLVVQKSNGQWLWGSKLEDLAAISVAGYDTFEGLILDRKGVLHGTARNSSNGIQTRFHLKRGSSLEIDPTDVSLNILARNSVGDFVANVDGILFAKMHDGSSFQFPSGYSLATAGVSENGEFALSKASSGYLWKPGLDPISVRSQITSGQPADWTQIYVTNIADFDLNGKMLVDMRFLGHGGGSAGLMTAAMLTPVPELGACISLAAGLCVLALHRRRR